ncbi:hypothetical protein CH63R_00433 [Colletotrichum higginsianum IMI 349063]|uniref:Uncharacterized protein n=1 Tax=Colletotrichum higginsianum (strain IMI 349063) TaxID=759273 RepID=A0A1B7YTB7_COLHI|nr:hypothetical protein CH63R_00433 [Colletotrichum higginsianum IMI 349063]OBR15253.1 hypothetical protein CH63R_00433 [Colletotrichum higginsianum IMI 349063]
MVTDSCSALTRAPCDRAGASKRAFGVPWQKHLIAAGPAPQATYSIGVNVTVNGLAYAQTTGKNWRRPVSSVGISSVVTQGSEGRKGGE